MARDRASRPEAKLHRLFVALEVPAAAQLAVDAAVAPWREVFPRARWVPVENRHVTLRFLGGTYPRLLAWVQERVGEAAASRDAFETRLSGLGVFPPQGKARVLWVGLADPDGHMAALASALDAALAPELTPESRAFAPHLTVARSDPPLALPPDFVDTAVEPVAWRVERIVLFESHLRRPAPIYEPLAAFALREPSRG